MLNLMVLFVVIYSAFSTYSCITYYDFFQVVKIIGGGGAKRYVSPLPYFHWGATAPPALPPPPQDQRLCEPEWNVCEQ